MEMGIILHITDQRAWQQSLSTGYYSPPSLVNEGFIHCSMVEQTVKTANRFFHGQAGLVLLCIDVDKLKAEVRFESPAHGTVHEASDDQLFPHIYGPLEVSSVLRVVEFAPGSDGGFELPTEISGLSTNADIGSSNSTFDDNR